MSLFLLGDLHIKLPGRTTRGLFFSTILDRDPFMNTSLRNFVDVRTDSIFSCFLDTIVYKEKNHPEYNEKTDILSCAFRGTLKVGPLQFKTTEINFLMGNHIGSNTTPINSVKLTGILSKSEDLTFGIFKRDPGRCVDVQFLFVKDTPEHTGSFCAVCNIFGMEKSVNVSISNNDIKFRVLGKMHNQFDASMNFSSRILPWESQIFDVDGRFERNTGETDFVRALEKELESYAKNTISLAMKRRKAVDQTVERARIRLEKVESLRKVALEKLQRLASNYASAKEHFQLAQVTLQLQESKAGNYSKDVERLKLELDNLCNIKQCDEVCQEGIYCSTCYEYITENSKGMCPATCFQTKQRRIPPYSEVVYCVRTKCERIHRKSGFFGKVFGDALGGIIKKAFSIGITAVATKFGAPLPVATALGQGITTLVDTGSVDKALCSARQGFVAGSIGGAIGGLPGKGVASKAIVSCPRKSGRWKCWDLQVKCEKGIFEYEYKHIPYGCKKSCVVEKIARTIEKSCCQSVTCASLVVNTTCVVQNAVCKKARKDALERISKTKSEAKNILQNLNYARSNVSYWKIKAQKRYSRVLRHQRWVNMTLRSTRSLEKTYNSTVESKNELEKLLSRPLRLISLFNKQLTSADGIKMKEIRFTAKVFRGNDDKLLPIDITFEANGTQRQLSTVFDFAQVNTSLKSIAEEITVDIITNIFGSSRTKRSADIPVTKPDTLLFSLKQYHSYCAKFTNYHDLLYNVAQSLYNLSTEYLLVKTALSHMSFNDTSLITSAENVLNQTMASKFALEEGYDSLSDYYKDDPEFLEAFEQRQEEMQHNYESLNSTSKLLIYNWFANVEDIFNTSRMSYECSGMSDCTKHILDSLLQMFSVIETDGVDQIRQHIQKLGIQLEYLSNSTNTTIEEGLQISTEILTILGKMKEVEVVCAQSPNITKHPEPIIDLGTRKVLVLNCNATGTALLYSWTFNGNTLEDQKTNVLTIKNTAVSNSGNYTCIVSNHIAREKSLTAVVNIHPPPIIIKQPVEYLAAVLAEDDSLQCEVEETSNNVSYQWWFKPDNSSSSFKPDNSSSSFEPLPNETFPYLNFSPIKAKDEGWYFCQVSNSYGQTKSRISLVKTLSFTLPVPVAVLSFSLRRETKALNSNEQPSNFTDYAVFSSHIMKQIWSRNDFSDALHVKNIRPINCVLRKNKNESNGNFGICSWEFQYVGRNVTSNVTVGNEFEVNAGMVVNATQELSDAIERLVNSTNNGSLSFSVAGSLYIAQRNSMAIHKYTLMCPRSQVLLQNDFKCGKRVLINIHEYSFYTIIRSG